MRLRASSALRGSSRGERLYVAAALALGGVAAVALGPAIATLVLVAAASAAVGSRAPALIPVTAVLLLPAGLFRPSVFGVQAPLLEVALGAMAAGYGLPLLATRKIEIRAAEASVLALVAAVVVSGLSAEDKAYWLHEVVFWTGAAVLFYASVRALADPPAVRRFVLALAAVGVFAAVLAVVEYFRERGDQIVQQGGAVVWERSQATLGHPGALAGFLVLCLFPVLGLVAVTRGVRRAALAVAALALVVGIVTTYTRTAWVVVAVGCAILAIERRLRRPIAAAAAAAALAAVTLGGGLLTRLSSIASGDLWNRVEWLGELWSRAARDVAERPLTGPGSVHELAVLGDMPVGAAHPHNLLLGLAVDFGVIAPVAFAALAFLALRSAWTAWRAGGPLAPLALATLTALALQFLADTIGYPFWHEALTTLIVLMLALAVALGRAATEPKRR